MLPTTRPRTYVMGMPVIPDDFNEIFDSITGAKHPTLTLSFDPRKLQAIQPSVAPVTVTNALITRFGADIVTSSSLIAAGLTLEGIPAGTRITAVRTYLKDVAGQPAVTCGLRGGDRAGSSSLNATTGTSAASGAVQTMSMNLATPHVVGVTTPGPAFLTYLTSVAATGTYSFYAVEVDIDRL